MAAWLVTKKVRLDEKLPSAAACACVRRGAGLICSSKAASGNDGAVGTETMD